MYTYRDLSGTVVAITGATAGIGREIARQLVEEGARVALGAGCRGGADEAVYAGTKHAQVGLAGALDRELREKGIRVTLICPAGTTTEFAVGAGRTDDDPRAAEWLVPADIAAAVVTTLKQPRSMRTAIWTLWSMGQGS